MSEGKSEKDRINETLEPITPTSNRIINSHPNRQKSEHSDSKKSDEVNEQNTDSNKSNHVFQTPNPHSSSSSNREDFPFTPKRNQTNFFIDSNSRKSYLQKKSLNINK